jgi:hypothetical protein
MEVICEPLLLGESETRMGVGFPICGLNFLVAKRYFRKMFPGKYFSELSNNNG